MEKFTLTNSVVKIANVEDLHSKFTKLKQLKFIHIEFCNEDVEQNQFLYFPSESLVSLSLKDISQVQRQNGLHLGNAIRSWVKYIGIKYPWLRELHLHSCYQDGEDESVTRSSVIALKYMKHLEASSCNFCPALQSILDAIITNNT